MATESGAGDSLSVGTRADPGRGCVGFRSISPAFFRQIDKLVARWDHFRHYTGVVPNSSLALRTTHRDTPSTSSRAPRRRHWIFLPKVLDPATGIADKRPGPQLRIRAGAPKGQPPNERAVAYDLPITDWSGDRLGRGPFIASIAKEILVHNAPVIAIDGPFGEGKTSALNLLANSLSGRKDIIVVRFNSWLPGDEGALAVTLYATIADQVLERFFVPKFSSELHKYARLIAGSIPKLGDVLKDLFSPPSQEQQLNALRDVLNRCPVRIAVLVDELDRMDARELAILLKIVRGVADLPNLSFVCAANHRSLVRTMSPGDLGYGRILLEKFFPLRFRLPPADRGLLSKIFDQQFEKICKEFHLLETEEEQKAFNDKFFPLWQSNIKFWMNNIRRLSLFFNSLHAALTPVHQEVNLYDMFILQIVKQESDDVYEFIFENGPLFYYPEWRIWNFLENQSSLTEANDKLRSDRIKAFLEGLDKDIRMRITPLLEEIFPTVEGVRRDRFLGRVGEDAAARGRRIFHPDYFARYFINQVPSEMYGQEELNKVVRMLNESQSIQDCSARFSEILKSLDRSGIKRWSFLDGMVHKVEPLGDLQCEAVALGIARFDDSLEADFLGVGEWGRARALMFEAMNRFSGTQRIQTILASAILEASSDRVALEIVGFCTDNRANNNLITSWDHVDGNGLKAAFAHRMQTAYQVGSMRPIPQRIRDLNPFLFWSRYDQEARQSQQAFFRFRFKHDVHEIPRFLEWVTPMEAMAYQEHPVTFLDRIYPSEELHRLISEQEQDVWDQNERRIIAKFLERLMERTAVDQATNETRLGPPAPTEEQ